MRALALLAALALALPPALAGSADAPEASDPAGDTPFAPADLLAAWMEEDGKGLVLRLHVAAFPSLAEAGGAEMTRQALQLGLRFQQGTAQWEWRITYSTSGAPDGTPGLDARHELLLNGTDVLEHTPTEGTAADGLATPPSATHSFANDAPHGLRGLRYLAYRDRLAAGSLLTNLTAYARSLADTSLNVVACGGLLAEDCATGAVPYRVGTPPPLPGLTLAAPPLNGTAGNRTLQVAVRNAGDIARTLGFEAVLPPGWQGRFEPATLAVPAAAQANATLLLEAAPGQGWLQVVAHEGALAGSALVPYNVSAAPAPAPSANATPPAAPPAAPQQHLPQAPQTTTGTPSAATAASPTRHTPLPLWLPLLACAAAGCAVRRRTSRESQ
jgi:hypothetical protein